MSKKYVAVRMPTEAYNKFVIRQARLEKVASKITRKAIKIPLTKVFSISAENPINITDTQLIKVARKVKKC